jgi:exodeoxyribonuclease VII large subunit
MNLFNEKKILTVSQLTNLIRGVLEENFEQLWIEGEVSNLAMPSSGHLYFTLKDSGATIRCVMFRAAAKALRFRLVDGIRVVLRGRVTVYEQRGDYQLIAEYLEPQGLGALQLAFQQLKERLAKEGLFAESRKTAIPLLPQTVGIITSPTGAAIHDILNVIGRRHAGLRIVICPVRVQGEGAAAEIATALADMNSLGEAEVIILARGGGSIEDLWSFNEEVVVRAIAASTIPVISAVGHEIDITIADLAADLRAPTPSAAAEMVVNSKLQMSADCAALERRLLLAMQRQTATASSRLEILKLSLKTPELLVERFMQRLDDLQQRSATALAGRMQTCRQRALAAADALQHKSPMQRIVSADDLLQKLSLRSSAAIRAQLEASGSSFAVATGRLQMLSPLAVLARGYAVVRKLPAGCSVSRVAQIAAGDSIAVQFNDGTATCHITNIVASEPYTLDSQAPRH